MSQSTPQCRCNQDAANREVKKEGRNKGRHFWCCAKPQSDSCGFFEWDDDAPRAQSFSATKRPREETADDLAEIKAMLIGVQQALAENHKQIKINQELILNKDQ